MIHRKARSLMSAPEAIATVAAAALSQAASQQTGPTGSVVTHNSDGTKTITGPVLGTDATGTSVTTATHVGDTTPPGRPLGIAGASSAGVVYVAWGGKLDGGIPSDFDHVSLYMTVSGVDQLVGTLTKAGIVSTIPMQTTATVEVWATAEDDACLADGTAAHNISGTSDRATVTVTQAADSASVQKLQDGITQAVNDAATAKSDAAEAKAETKDLVTLRIDSSRGTVFKNSEVSTVLTVRCYKRGEEITTLTALRDAMGDQTARIRWCVLRAGDADWVSLADSDGMLSNDGFTLTVTPSDVEVKCTFKAEVVTD